MARLQRRADPPAPGSDERDEPPDGGGTGGGGSPTASSAPGEHRLFPELHAPATPEEVLRACSALLERAEA